MSAPLPILQAYQPGRPVVAIIKNPATGLYWNTSTVAWESYTIGNAALYQISLTDPNGIGQYSAAFPTALAGMTVWVIVYDTASMTSPIGATQLSPPDTTGGLPATSSASILVVVNKALTQLGVTNIASLTEDSEAANKVSLLVDCLRQSLLRSHYWKFATFQDTLVLLANETPMGFAYLYTYPSMCMMVRRIFDDNSATPGNDPLMDYRYYGDLWVYHHPEFRYKQIISPSTLTKSIACNVNPAYIEYTYDITDPTFWDQSFYDCMVFSLAAELCVPLTGKPDLAKDLRSQAVAYITEAKRLDAQEDNSRHKMQSSYVNVRA